MAAPQQSMLKEIKKLHPFNTRNLALSLPKSRLFLYFCLRMHEIIVYIRIYE